MAALLNEKTSEKVYLNGSHSFGRRVGRVDTVIKRQDVSNFHAVAQWTGGSWVLRDISRNGTWVNGERLEKHQLIQLKLGQRIHFAYADNAAWIVDDLSPPKDMLIAMNADGDNRVLKSNMILLGDSHSLLIYYNSSDGSWYSEVVDGKNIKIGQPTKLSNQKIIMFGKSVWRVQLCDVNEITRGAWIPQPKLFECTFEFWVSLDEEDVNIRMEHPFNTWDLGVKTYHCLLLYLARWKIKHAEAGIKAIDQGWVENELLALELGYDEQYISILIYRIRQFFSKEFGFASSESLIQRKRGKTRLGVDVQKIKIYKNSELHCFNNVEEECSQR